MSDHQHGAVGGFEWWETRMGWLVRHYLDNGRVVGVLFEKKEDAVKQAYERAAEQGRIAEKERIAWEHDAHQRRIAYTRARRKWSVLTPAQYLVRNDRVLMLRSLGFTYAGIGSRERVRQVILKAARVNRRRFATKRAKRVTLDAYLFRKHGFGGRQYRLGG